jgi:hypothetical protein
MIFICCCYHGGLLGVKLVQEEIIKLSTGPTINRRAPFDFTQGRAGQSLRYLFAYHLASRDVRSEYSGQALIRGLVEENSAKAGLEENRPKGRYKFL